MAVNIGRLDRRVVIEQAAETQNSSGEAVPTWSELATVWASVRPARTVESVQGDQEHAVRETVFRVRHRTDVTEKMRVSYGGKVYDIAGIVEIGRREALDLTGVVRALG